LVTHKRHLPVQPPLQRRHVLFRRLLDVVPERAQVSHLPHRADDLDVVGLGGTVGGNFGRDKSAERVDHRLLPRRETHHPVVREQLAQLRGAFGRHRRRQLLFFQFFLRGRELRRIRVNTE